MLLGLAGYGGAGKDTVARVLADVMWRQSSETVTILAFADPLRDFTAAINPIVYWGRGQKIMLDEESGEEYAIDEVLPYRYRDALDDEGYGRAKELFPEFREILQRVGTDGGRKVFGENFWVEMAMRRVVDGVVNVFTDVRFINEADAIRKAGGSIVRVERPGVGRVNDHVSETEMEPYGYDYRLQNDGSEEDLYAKVLAMALATGIVSST